MSVYRLVEQNIFRSWIFIFIFSLIIIGLGLFFSYILNLAEIFYFSLMISFVQGILSFYYCDKFILSFSRARPLDKDQYKGVYNLVENLSITAGIETPKLYLLEDASINAFATGRNPNNGVICLTKGAIEKLEKSELEGIIAHEISHIKNNDILLMSVLAILVSGIALLSRWIFRFSYFSRSKKDEKNNSGIILLIGFLVALLAYLFATLLKLAISRKREFLADASGVLLTRYPEGLINAFKKILKDSQETQVFNPAFSHLFIAEPHKKRSQWFLNLFSTHPPIEERIRALESLDI